MKRYKLYVGQKFKFKVPNYDSGGYHEYKYQVISLSEHFMLVKDLDHNYNQKLYYSELNDEKNIVELAKVK